MSVATDSAEWLARGRTHRREGRSVDAMLCFRHAIHADPRAADPHFGLGEVLWHLGRIPDAIAAWREASHLAPASPGSWQALAEALLSIGDAAGARDAAQRMLALAPGNSRAEIVVGVSNLIEGNNITHPSPVALIKAALEREPALLGDGTLAGSLALALEGTRSDPQRSELLAYAARSTTAALAPMRLLALALEEMAVTSNAEAQALRTVIVSAIRSRGAAPNDLDALRRIAIAAARFDPGAAAEFAARYAEHCTALASSMPTAWPQRTAGERTRVIVLVAGATAGLDTIAALSRVDFAITVATVGAPHFSVGHGAATIALPASVDAAAANALAARDADVLIDLAGMNAATGSLLAQHPARQSWTVKSLLLPHASPLIDRIFDDPHSLAAALSALHHARDPKMDCALDATAVGSIWTEAVRAHQRGDRPTALAGYARVLDLQPGYALARYLSGVVHREQGRDTDARTFFAAAVTLAPRYVDARIASADAAIAEGDIDVAVALCQEGLLIAPAERRLLRALGRAYLARQDGPAAADAFTRALEVDMTDGETHYNHGVALQMQRHYSEAERAYRRALAFRPDLDAARFNLGVLYQEQGMTDAAVAAYGEVLSVDDGNVAAHRNLGEALFAAGRIEPFLANFRRFEVRCPDALPLAVQALVACQHLGDFPGLDRYLDALRQDRFAADGEAELVDALEELLYLLHYFDVDPQMLEHFSRKYDTAARRAYGAPIPQSGIRREGRVRIGYLSGDLRNHVMGKMSWSAVEHHDKSRFELFFYAISGVEDEWTAKYRGFADHFHSLANDSVRDAAVRIAADDLDILVDLSTHTKGARPGILALKPARVQVTHVASAGTVGLSTIDFKLTDHYADIPQNQAFQIEALLPMEGCVYPYRHIAPATDHPFHRTMLGIAPETVIIGAFVNPMKLSRRCLSLWRDVLAMIPPARLAFSPVNSALQGSYARLLAAGGIDSDRYMFLPQGRDDAENQARYALVDFVLDPMPYGGVNGTLEALDMGVPVVTLQGKRHAERTSYSILANLGVTETVATSGTEYAEIASRLAGDRSFMRTVRDRIRDGLRQSRLTDMPAHARALERAYLAALRAKAPEALAAAGERYDG